MLSINRLLTKTSHKLIFATFLSVVFLLITAVTRSSVRQAGGLACFFIAGILVLSVIKVVFLEFVEDEEKKAKGRKILEFLHASFGWIALILVIYHSLYFLTLAFFPENNISPNYFITGALALIPMGLVVVSGLDKNITVRKKVAKSMYFNHLAMAVLLAVLTVIHINFQ
ncbi:MAG: iron reductase [Desulfitobacterium sp.]|nr:iron reductase [Desulfitobacterium sp.]